MAPAVRRRLTPIPYANQIIEAINYIRTQKQIPNFDRISKQLHRNAEVTPRRCKEHLNNAVSDGLIMEYTAVGNKGSRTGLEQEGYRLPQQGEGEEVLNDGHDWYCFECHGPGEVHECSSCFRVYHQGCTREDTTGEAFTCSICWASRKKSKMRKKMLNTLLSYTMIHLKETTKELYKIGPKVNPEDMARYVFKKMDLHKMEQKVQASKYKCLDEFLADASIILHNCTLLFGDEKGGLTDLATVMVKACKYDIEEIDLCANCYYMSNAKPEDWFCQPCNPPHDLVFAKQKGYCYWPAKIVKDLEGKFDVRFFGGWHQRAVIPAEYTKPITSDVKKLAVKKTGGFTNAMKELKKHQKMLDERERELEATNGIREEDEEEEEEEMPAEDEEEKEEETEEKEESQEDEEGEEEAEESEEEKPKSKSKTTAKEKSKTPGKRGVKRSREEAEETEDDLDNRQVSSTSVDRQAKKRKRNSVRQTGQDESIQVTSSSVDKVSTTPPIATMNAAAQTTTVKMEDCSMQTDAEEDTRPPVITDTDMKTEEEKLNDISEDRMAKVIADLTQRLEEKFDDEKAKALKEQSDRLTEDFGKDKQQAVERTIANMNQNMKQEVEKARKMGEDSTRAEYMEEMKKLATRHKEAIAQAKKKQWCFNCGEESMYHCCWNTSYCSLKCQQEHWHKEHKRVCRRKRPAASAN